MTAVRPHRHHHPDLEQQQQRLPATERDVRPPTTLVTTASTHFLLHLHTPTQSASSADSTCTTRPRCWLRRNSARCAAQAGSQWEWESYRRGRRWGRRIIVTLINTTSDHPQDSHRPLHSAIRRELRRAAAQLLELHQIPPASSQNPTLPKKILLLRLFLRCRYSLFTTTSIQIPSLVGGSSPSHPPSRATRHPDGTRARLAAAGHFRVADFSFGHVCVVHRHSALDLTRSTERPSVECAVGLQILTNGCMMGRRHGPGLSWYFDTVDAPRLRQYRYSNAGFQSTPILAQKPDNPMLQRQLSSIPPTITGTILPVIVVSRFIRAEYPQSPASCIILPDPFLAVHHRPTQYFPVLGRKTSHPARSFLLSAAYPTWATASTLSVVTERRGRVGRCLQMLGKARRWFARIGRLRAIPLPAAHPRSVRIHGLSTRPPPEKLSQAIREDAIRSTRPPCSFHRFSQTHIPFLTTPFLAMVTTATVLGTPRAFSTTSPPSG
ncbi:hypothetical protein C8F01DRAFT_1290408 [Mycena amicta]|nr:hypothetical protein C8F01DRAFT_1290408 [Mycena amicta]